MTTFAQLIHGIGVQESGNNYHVVNSIGAVGKYQVMKANIPSWSRKILGHSISWQTFRDSPALQEKIVQGILRGYFNKYGAAGAAAMWYSGQPNPNKTYGNPPVYKYVNSVIGIANRYKGTSLPGGGGGGGATSSGGSGYIAPTTAHLSSKELAAEYGFTAAFLDSNPELKKLFQQAVSGGWGKENFIAHLQDTKWWKTHSATEREYLAGRYTDPATQKQSLAQNQVRARQIGNQLGIVETAFTKKKMAQAAYNMTAKGWDENQVRYYLGQYVYFSGDKHQGQGGEEWDALHTYAYSMGITMTSSWYADKSRNIVRGIATEQDYKNEILNKAKAAFPMYQKQLEGGQTVADIANPYLQSMSQILELPGGSINLFDPTIKKALQYKNATTGKLEAKPLWQFENDLRADPRWKKTQNAQDSMMQVAHQVLTDFGVKY